MFVAGFDPEFRPAAGDAVFGVDGDRVIVGEFGALDVDDAHMIGFLDGAPVWAGRASGGMRWSRLIGEVAPPEDEIVARAYYSVRWRRTNRFCGECGGPLEDCPGFSTRRCPVCVSLPYVPQALTPAVIVAITSANRLLLARHAYYPGPIKWALIAGMVEPGESLESAVRREVNEEVGLEITNVRYACSRGFSLDSPSALMIGFTADAGPDAVPRVDGTELTEARWFTRAEFAALPAEMLPARHAINWPLMETWSAR